MTCYSIKPRDRIFMTGYAFLPFAKSIDKNLSGKYSQKQSNTIKYSLGFVLNNLLQIHLKLLQN